MGYLTLNSFKQVIDQKANMICDWFEFGGPRVWGHAWFRSELGQVASTQGQSRVTCWGGNFLE
jgi:hypothetical protein